MFHYIRRRAEKGRMRVFGRLQGGRGLFKPRPTVETGRRLYASAAAQARLPGFYVEAGAPDTPEGRFELYTLHVVLILHRLKGQGPETAEVAQAAFDAYLRNLDDALRDMGVGDLSVGKKMRKLGEAFYGRAKSYDLALAALPDPVPLRALIERTIFAGGGSGATERIASYVAQTVERLAAQPLADLLQAGPAWPETAP
jgi:cytochrome b pre-mRNA-processing protein 3